MKNNVLEFLFNFVKIIDFFALNNLQLMKIRGQNSLNLPKIDDKGEQVLSAFFVSSCLTNLQ